MLGAPVITKQNILIILSIVIETRSQFLIKLVKQEIKREFRDLSVFGNTDYTTEKNIIPKIGAFEITLQGYVIFSKLKTGVWPTINVIAPRIRAVLDGKQSTFYNLQKPIVEDDVTGLPVVKEKRKNNVPLKNKKFLLQRNNTECSFLEESINNLLESENTYYSTLESQITSSTYLPTLNPNLKKQDPILSKLTGSRSYSVGKQFTEAYVKPLYSNEKTIRSNYVLNQEDGHIKLKDSTTQTEDLNISYPVDLMKPSDIQPFLKSIGMKDRTQGYSIRQRNSRRNVSMSFIQKNSELSTDSTEPSRIKKNFPLNFDMHLRESQNERYGIKSYQMRDVLMSKEQKLAKEGVNGQNLLMQKKVSNLQESFCIPDSEKKLIVNFIHKNNLIDSEESDKKNASNFSDYHEKNFQNMIFEEEKVSEIKVPKGKVLKKKISLVGDQNHDCKIEVYSSVPDILVMKSNEILVPKATLFKISLKFEHHSGQVNENCNIYILKNGRPWQKLLIEISYI